MAGIEIATGELVKDLDDFSDLNYFNSACERDIDRGWGYFRGHHIVYKNDRWEYKNNSKPLPGWGGEAHPCKKCGSKKWSGSNEADHPDECLGNLPGVSNACCGHGHRDNSYIAFTNGVIVRGFVVTKN